MSVKSNTLKINVIDDWSFYCVSIHVVVSMAFGLNGYVILFPFSFKINYSYIRGA